MTAPALAILLAAGAGPLDAAPATPAPAATPIFAAVVVAGDEAAGTGDLQRELERRLAAAVPGLSVRVASDVAARIAAPVPAATPPPVDASALAQMNEAIGAYYDAQFVKALDLFAKVQLLYESAQAPVARRAEVRLWRVAVFLGLKDATAAQAEALAALALDPELRVDPRSEVPPSVQQALDGARASASFKLVTIIVNGLPPTAELTVDGRSVPSRFKVLAGKHKIVASSRGRQDVTRVVEALGDLAITVSLPIALAPETATAVHAFAEGGDAKGEVGNIASRLDAEWVVFASLKEGTVHAALWRRSDGSVAREGPHPAGGATAKVTDAFAGRIARAKDRPPAGRPVVADDGSWSVSTRATLAAMGWGRSISGGETFETFFGGAGPELRVEAAKGRFLAAGAGSWISYDASRLEVELPDGTRRESSGGTTARVLAGAGWRGFGEDGDRFRALASLDVERHASTDPAAAAGATGLNLLTGYTRAAFELRGAMRFAAPSLPSWRIDVQLGVAPYAWFAEDPKGASGKAPLSRPAYLAGLGLETAPSAMSRWGARVAWAGEVRAVRFAGASRAAVDPPMRDAVLQETFHQLSLSLSRRF